MRYSKEESKMIWDQNAEFWDYTMGDESNDFHRNVVRPKVTELLNPNSSDYILDIACGNGNYSAYLAEKGISVVGFDYGEKMIELAKGINNMLNAIQAGIFTPSTKQRLDELEETKSQLEVSILQEEMHKPLLTREQIAFFIYRFRKFDVTKREQRQRLIDSFVNAVYLYEDKIILTFNYKDGSKTITLADVEGSDLSSFGAP